MVRFKLGVEIGGGVRREEMNFFNRLKAKKVEKSVTCGAFLFDLFFFYIRFDLLFSFSFI
jgi:hypothetical protein